MFLILDKDDLGYYAGPFIESVFDLCDVPVEYRFDTFMDADEFIEHSIQDTGSYEVIEYE